MIVLIMGLPGSGKTTLAQAVMQGLFFRTGVLWLNADKVRKENEDWDFSEEGRIRQSTRMRDLADASGKSIIIIDMVCPLPIMRTNINPDIVIWVDTIKEGRYEDTNKVFVPPSKYDLRVTTQDCKWWGELVVDKISANMYA
jgi:adenylylsulfate kinase